jgi:hypothetical protein
MQSRIASHEALVLTLRVVGRFFRMPPGRRPGLQVDRSPMYGPMASGSGTYGPAAAWRLVEP